MFPVLVNAMGHVNIFSTQIYIHVDAADLHRASAKFNAHLAYSREDSK
jgi:site-specific recombinase XerD